MLLSWVMTAVQRESSRIRTHIGVHCRDITHHVDHQKVYLLPLSPPKHLGGFSYGFGDAGFVVGGSGGIGLGIGSIAALTLLHFFSLKWKIFLSSEELT